MRHSARLVTNVAMAYVGAGVLALPYAFSQCEPMIGVAVLLVVGLATAQSASLLIDCKSRISDIDVEERYFSHGDVAKAAFGATGALAGDVALTMAQMGFASAYFLFVVKSLESFFGGSFSHLIFIAALAPFLYATTFIRDLNKFAVVSFVSQIVNLIAFAAIFNELLTSDKKIQVDNETRDFDLRSLGLFLSLATYSFEGAGLVLSLEESAHESIRNNFVSHFSSTVSVISGFYAIFGVYGFRVFGGKTAPLISDNLPPATAALTKLCFSFSLFFSYPLMIFPVGNMLQKRFRSNNSKVINLSLVLTTAFIIAALPNMADLLELVGSCFCSLVAFLLPGLCHARLSKQVGLKNTLISAFGILCMALGLWDWAKNSTK